MQVLHQEETPLLYSLVFGEGVVNDATSVVLFNAIQKLDIHKIQGWTAFHVLTDFLYLFFTSTVLGIAVSEAYYWNLIIYSIVMHVNAGWQLVLANYFAGRTSDIIYTQGVIFWQVNFNTLFFVTRGVSLYRIVDAYLLHSTQVSLYLQTLHRSWNSYDGYNGLSVLHVSWGK